MNFEGVIIGLAAFITIGVFHPIVIKGEYYFGKKIWPVFLVAGILFIILSIAIKETVFSAIVGVVGFSCLWKYHIKRFFYIFTFNQYIGVVFPYTGKYN